MSDCPITEPATDATPRPAPIPVEAISPSSEPPPALVRDVLDDLTFNELYRAEYDGMVRAAFLLVGDAEVAEEVVQDAFVATHQRWDRLDSPGGYLRTCVMNGCRDRIRRRVRLHALIPILASRDRDDGASVSDRGDLHDVLLTLPLRQRAAVVGRYYCGWDDAAIAEALGIRPATVRSLVHRGLAALRIELTP